MQMDDITIMLAEDIPAEVDETMSEEDVFGHGGALDEGDGDAPVAVAPPPPEDVKMAEAADNAHHLEDRLERPHHHVDTSTRRRDRPTMGAQTRDYVAEAVERLGSGLRRRDTDAAVRMQRLRRRIADKQVTRAAADGEPHAPGQERDIHSADVEHPPPSDPRQGPSIDGDSGPPREGPWNDGAQIGRPPKDVRDRTAVQDAVSQHSRQSIAEYLLPRSPHGPKRQRLRRQQHGPPATAWASSSSNSPRAPQPRLHGEQQTCSHGGGGAHGA